MGVTLNGIFQIGLSGLKAQTAALSVISQNLTNSSTPGYDREIVNLSNVSADSTQGAMGSGVNVDSVQRVTDPLATGNYQYALGQQGQSTLLNQSTSSVQNALGSINGPNLGTALGDFFDAFQNLTTDPSDLALRQVAVSGAGEVASYFNGVSQQLDQVQAGLDQGVSGLSGQINSLLGQVATLNQQIGVASTAGNTPNDLLDQRDQALNTLSGLINVDVTQSNNEVILSCGGVSLVSGAVATQIQVDTSGTHPALMTAAGTDLAPASGQAAGYAQSYQALDSTRASLDQLANAFSGQINALTTSGYDLNGNPGQALFTGSGAANIAVNPAMAANPALLALGSTAASGDAGVATQITQLQDENTVPPGSGAQATFQGAYTDLVTTVGSAAQQAGNMQTNFTQLASTLQQQIQGITGVSSDEELTNMLAVQQAYQAAAQIISTVNNVMENMLTTMGVISG